MKLFSQKKKKNLKALAKLTVVSSAVSTVGDVFKANPVLAAHMVGIGATLGTQLIKALDAVIDSKRSNISKQLFEAVAEDGVEELYKVMKASYRQTLDAISRGYLERYIEADKAYLTEQMPLFVSHLFDVLVGNTYEKVEEINNALNKAGQIDPDRHFSLIIDNYPLSFPNAGDRNKIKLYFKLNFPTYFRKFFLIEFKDSKDARDQYLTFLSEQIAVNTFDLQADVKVLTSLQRQTGIGISKHLERLDQKTGTTIELLKLLRLEESIIRNKVQKIEELITAQSEIPLRSLERPRDPQHVNDYEYKHEYTEFIGRMPELSSLWDFIEDERKFRWVMLSGPSGIGKSRLAYEFCKILEQVGIRAGFYDLERNDSATSSKWNQYSFFGDTVIVIDYALSKTNDITKIIEILEDRRYTIDSGKIRLILVDRDIDESWNNITKQRAVNNSGFRISHSGNLPQIALTSFDDEQLIAIIEQTHTKGNKAIVHSREDIIKQLQSIDDKKRPLYALLAGIAMVDSPNNDLRHWNRENLLEHHLLRLRKSWAYYPEFVTHGDELEELLIWNTLIGGVHENVLDQAAESFNIEWSSIFGNYHRIAEKTLDPENGKVIYYGLLPDILGEYYIFNQIKQMYHGRHSEKAMRAARLRLERIFGHAWEISPYAIASTLSRFYQDFRNEYLYVAGFIESNSVFDSLTEPSIVAVCALYGNIIISSINGEHLETAEIYVAKLFAFIDKKALHSRSSYHPDLMNVVNRVAVNYSKALITEHVEDWQRKLICYFRYHEKLIRQIDKIENWDTYFVTLRLACWLVNQECINNGYTVIQFALQRATENQSILAKLETTCIEAHLFEESITYLSRTKDDNFGVIVDHFNSIISIADRLKDSHVFDIVCDTIQNIVQKFTRHSEDLNMISASRLLNISFNDYYERMTNMGTAFASLIGSYVFYETHVNENLARSYALYEQLCIFTFMSTDDKLLILREKALCITRITCMLSRQNVYINLSLSLARELEMLFVETKDNQIYDQLIKTRGNVEGSRKCEYSKNRR